MGGIASAAEAERCRPGRAEAVPPGGTAPGARPAWRTAATPGARPVARGVPITCIALPTPPSPWRAPPVTSASVTRYAAFTPRPGVPQCGPFDALEARSWPGMRRTGSRYAEVRPRPLTSARAPSHFGARNARTVPRVVRRIHAVRRVEPAVGRHVAPRGGVAAEHEAVVRVNMRRHGRRGLGRGTARDREAARDTRPEPRQRSTVQRVLNFSTVRPPRAFVQCSLNGRIFRACLAPTSRGAPPPSTSRACSTR